MIKIKDYKEALAEIIAKVNSATELDINISPTPVLAPDENDFAKRISELSGLILGGSYPPDDTSSADEDSYVPEYDCLLFLIKKLDLSSMSNEELEQFYDKASELMTNVIDLIRDNDFGCDKDIRSTGKFHVEYESNYNGFYGKSVSFNLQ